MPSKRISSLILTPVLFMAVIFSANLASAVEWTPLVRIPGLPATGTVNLSMYLIGLYNFLLSIVGIVAVVMLIIGGMRYITAVGNPSAISDAKDIVNSAIIGLILALLSWVFISAINPDVLYIKQPSGTDPSLAVKKLGNCWTTYTLATGACVCIDSFPAPVAATEQICQDFCKVDHCGPPTATPCIAPGSPVDKNDPYYSAKPYNSRCQCIDDVFIEPVGGAANCNEACSDSTMASDAFYHCGSRFLVVKLDTTLAVPDHDSTFVYIDSSISEMWRFFLTNDGTVDEFDVSASSYTADGITYDCAILITDENTLFPDTDKVIWVKAGAMIKNSGNSLENDIGSDYYNDTCPGDVFPFGDGACRLDIGVTGYDLSTVLDDFANQRGAIKIFKTKYNFIQDDCEKNEYCLFAKSRAEYRPIRNIVCDPVLKAWVAR